MFIHVITFPSPCVSSSSCDTGVHYTFSYVNMLYIIIAYHQEEKRGGSTKDLIYNQEGQRILNLLAQEISVYILVEMHILHLFIFTL